VRIGIVSDIHGNFVALRTVLKHMGSVDALWCLGDLVGYGPQPNEVVATICELPSLCIPGNHDWGMLGRLNPRSFNKDARSILEWTKKELTKEHTTYIESLPLQITALQSAFTLVHASPRDPMWEYLLDLFDAAECFPLFNSRYCFVGHTHVPLVFRQVNGSVKAIMPEADDTFRLNLAPYTTDEPNTGAGSRMIINPGSVGQPRDNDPRAAYMLLDIPDDMSPLDLTARLHFVRTEYPVEETQQLMRAQNFPPRLIARLASGI
jgi:diadenosine tetraphosphatase ApaH/serine/threonine PP2A family protein phosphatase